MTAAKEPAPRQALFSILHVGTGRGLRGSPPRAAKAAFSRAVADSSSTSPSWGRPGKKREPLAPLFFSKNSLPCAPKAALSPGGGGQLPRLLQLGQAQQKREPPGSPFFKTHRPVLPKPLSPRAVAERSSTSPSWGRPGKKMGAPRLPLFLRTHCPVLPKPPSPRAVAESSSASSSRGRHAGMITSWAMRSPGCTV